MKDKGLQYFQRDAEALKDLLHRRLPEKAVELAEQMVLDSFGNEQYQGDDGSAKWKARKKSDKNKSHRGLLVQSGSLRRSITVHYDASQRAVIFSSDKEVGRWNLAQIHNEGLKPVPQRQFMPLPGEAIPVLEQQLQQWLDEELKKVLG